MKHKWAEPGVNIYDRNVIYIEKHQSKTNSKSKTE